MKHFHIRNFSKGVGNFREPLFSGDLLKLAIKSGPLQFLTGRRLHEIAFGVCYDACGIGSSNLNIASLQILKENLGVLFFVFRRFQKNVRNLFKTLFSGGTGEIGISISCLRLTGEGCQ
jgi:hypothetical protein